MEIPTMTYSHDGTLLSHENDEALVHATMWMSLKDYAIQNRPHKRDKCGMVPVA